MTFNAVSADTLPDMYKREAIRNLVGGKDQSAWTGGVRKRLYGAYNRAFSDLEFDGSMHLYPANWKEAYEHSRAHDFMLGSACIDPLWMDAVDCIIILASFDADQAHYRNDVGPGKVWSPETHRIVSQIQEIGRLNRGDIKTIHEIVGEHRVQLSGHIANLIDADQREVAEILRQRHERGDLLRSSRIAQMYDPIFDFRNATYVWSTSNYIRVHIARGKDRAPYIALYHALKEWPEARQFYAQYRPLDKYGRRIINGVEEAYSSIRFPPEPEFAERLIELARRVDPDVIVCVSTNALVNNRDVADLADDRPFDVPSH